MSTKLQDFFGVFWPMIKPYVAGIRIEFDAHHEALMITKGETLTILKFKDIEDAVNEQGNDRSQPAMRRGG